MKENNGKAARRQFWQRVVVVGASILAVTIVLGYIYRRVVVGADMNERYEQRHGAFRKKRHFVNTASLSARRQRGGDGSDGDGNRLRAATTHVDDRMQALRDGVYQLVDLDVRPEDIRSDGSYQGRSVRGHFCQVDWQSHKVDPSTTPMFRDVIGASPDCDDPWIVPDLAAVVAELRASDTNNAHVHTLDIGGLVFHESRCGSTLVANLLQAAHPAAHRVHSESPPPLTVLRLGELRPAQQLSTLLRDVLYLMARSNDPAETRVFFKIQSVGSRHIAVAQQALPAVPWMFVFRDGVQILMSHFAAGPKHVRRSNCARMYGRPPKVVRKRLAEAAHPGGAAVLDPGPLTVPVEAYCAAHFATLTESALQQLQAPHSLGRAVEYSQLPDVLWTDILPHVWKIALDDADIARMRHVAQQYSKGRGHKAGRFQEDNARKEEQAWPAVQDAAAAYLQTSYAALQALSGGGQA